MCIFHGSQEASALEIRQKDGKYMQFLYIDCTSIKLIKKKENNRQRSYVGVGQRKKGLEHIYVCVS